MFMSSIMLERSGIVKSYFHPHKRFFPPCNMPYTLNPLVQSPVPEREKSMTIAAGFRCKDGVILAADSQITLSDGGKTYQSKIFPVNDVEDCYIAYAGYADFAKELVAEVRNATRGKCGSDLVASIGGTYKRFWREHYTDAPKKERTWAYLLFTLRDGKRMVLYRAYARSLYRLNEGYVLLGCGESVAESLFDPMCRNDMTVWEAARTCIYACRKIKGYVEACGGDTEVKMFLDHNYPVSPSRFQHFMMVPERSTREIEQDFDTFDEVMLPVLLAYPDLDGVNPSQFRALLRSAEKRLEKSRVKKYRQRDKEDSRLWEESARVDDSLERAQRLDITKL